MTEVNSLIGFEGMLKVDSTRLFHLIDSSAHSPAAKLLSVYSCLETWLNAPDVRENIINNFIPETPLADFCPELPAYLLVLASKAKVDAPTIYVEQMLILAQGAIAEEIRHPGSGAFLKARDAAKCIMDTRTSQSSGVAQYRPMQGFVFSAGILCLMLTLLAPIPLSTSTTGPHKVQVTQNFVEPKNYASMSPDLMGRTIALKTKFDTGYCPAPQLINMPPDRVNGYINVVNANFSDRSASESEKLNAFLNWYDKYMARECKDENNQKIVLGMAK